MAVSLSTLPLVLLIALLCNQGKAQFVPDPYRTGPWVYASEGEMWPRPQMQKHYGTFFTVDGSKFKFQLAGPSAECEILQKAVPRITNRLFPKTATHETHQPGGIEFSNTNDYKGELNTVHVRLNRTGGCNEHYPTPDTDEHYEIKVDTPDAPGRAEIIAFSAWGALRGMESFTHLIYESKKTHDLLLKGTSVVDFPRFPFRGFMLDTSRHFLPKETILSTLNLMEMNKFNVFHWHITDDPSFPYESKTYPQLSLRGAFSPQHVYSAEDVKEIIEAARIRGIRVIPEIDTPGHTLSLSPSHPELLTECGTAESEEKEGRKEGKQGKRLKLPKFGPLNPIKSEVYAFATKFFKEIATVFPDKFLHLGGDEVDKTCWASNKEILEYMKKENITGQYNKLESLYIEKLMGIINDFGKNRKIPIVWEEVFVNGDAISPETVVDVWKDAWQSTLLKVTKSGHQAILSAPFYLNVVHYGIDWVPFYKTDPTSFGGTVQQQMLVKGGKVCVWGEFINEHNLINIAWPRASVVAERLWSSKTVKDVNDAAERLQEHACRMTKVGYPVAPPSGPSFCPIRKGLP